MHVIHFVHSGIRTDVRLKRSAPRYKAPSNAAISPNRHYAVPSALHPEPTMNNPTGRHDESDHASGADSKTPYRPYMVTLPNVVF